jgi:hypothetical protein
MTLEKGEALIIYVARCGTSPYEYFAGMRKGKVSLNLETHKMRLQEMQIAIRESLQECSEFGGAVEAALEGARIELFGGE